MILLIIVGGLVILSIILVIIAIISWMRFEFGNYSNKTSGEISSNKNNNQSDATGMQR